MGEGGSERSEEPRGMTERLSILTEHPFENCFVVGSLVPSNLSKLLASSPLLIVCIWTIFR